MVQSDDMEGYSPLLQTLLKNRGIETPDDIERFLKPDFRRDAHDPMLLSGMEMAVTRLFQAIEAREHIVIYADYDCDGIPGAVVFSDFFKLINYERYSVYIPDRHLEGYGLHTHAIRELAAKGATLIVTIDLGITAVEEVAYAQGMGIDVIVTDHHIPHDELPRAYAVINPKIPGYPYDMLCGSAVIFKVVQAFLGKYREYFNVPEGAEKWMLDMVGLATLSDMVPLTGENRVFAYYGMVVLQKTKRPGLKALYGELGLNPHYMTEDDVTFSITPRINAASRMATPMKAYELLASTDQKEAIIFAKELAELNDDRKTNVALIMKEVKKIMSEREEKPIIVIGSPKWRVGVLGLVASKLVDEYKKPAFVWGREGSDMIKGSCRSNGSIDVVELMKLVPDSIINEFGGHTQAGGFSLTETGVHEFESILIEKTQELPPLEANGNGFVDAPLHFDEVHDATYQDIARLAPYGLANQKPVFICEAVVIDEVKLFGKEKNHLELSFRTNRGRKITAIAFFKTDTSYAVPLMKGETVSLHVSLEKSYFRGRPELRLRIQHIF